MKLLIYICKKLLIFTFCLPINVVIHLIKPLVLIRFKESASDRIGHLACETEMYLQEKIFKKFNKKYKLSKNFDIFFNGSKICNRQLVKMWKRKLNIYPYLIMAPIYSTYKILKRKNLISEDHEIPLASSNDRDILNKLDFSNPSIYFSDKEIELGNNTLKSMGLYNQKFIVIHIRDENYIIENYRTSLKIVNLNNYIEAINFAISRGYKVVRVGKNPKDKFNLDHKDFIDYPFSNFQSDFMDLYLTYKCKLILGNNSGGTIAPLYLFRTTTVLTDFAPIGLMHTYSDKIFIIPKKFKNKKTGKMLNIKEIFSSNLGFSENIEDFFKKSVEVIDNTSQEIKEVLEEALDHIEEKKFSDEKMINMKKKFNKIFLENSKNYNNVLLHNKKRIMHGDLRFNLGSKFLKDNFNSLI